MSMTVSIPRLNRSVTAATGANWPARSCTAVVTISFWRCARFHSTRWAAMKFEMPSPAISVTAAPAVLRASTMRSWKALKALAFCRITRSIRIR